jgi:hypothetical protein
MVEKSSTIYNYRGNEVIEKLVSRYDLLHVLEEIIKNNKHKLLVLNA